MPDSTSTRRTSGRPAIDPDTMSMLIHDPIVAEVAKDVKGRLQRVVDGSCA